MNDTRPTTVGTGLEFAQAGGLLVKQGLQGAFGQAGGGRLSDLLHGVEVDVEPRAGVAEGAVGDDLAPPRRELPEFVQFLRCKRSACHDASCQRVTAQPGRGLATDGLRTRLRRTKPFMTSPR
jgi:hypothetical protein